MTEIGIKVLREKSAGWQIRIFLVRYVGARRDEGTICTKVFFTKEEALEDAKRIQKELSENESISHAIWQWRDECADYVTDSHIMEELKKHA